MQELLPLKQVFVLIKLGYYCLRIPLERNQLVPSQNHLISSDYDQVIIISQ